MLIPLYISTNFVPFNDLKLRSLVYEFFDILISCASIFQLTAISMERCFSIVAPMRHRSASIKYHYLMVFLVWSLAAINSLYYLLWYHHFIKGFKIYITLVCLVFPTLIITVSYILLFRAKIKRSHLSTVIKKGMKINWSNQTNAIMTLIIITGLFFVAWSPFFTWQALTFFYPSVLPSSLAILIRLGRLIKWIHYCNSALNPFVYAYRNKNFKQSFKVIIHACWKCKRFSEVNREFSLRGHFEDI